MYPLWRGEKINVSVSKFSVIVLMPVLFIFLFSCRGKGGKGADSLNDKVVVQIGDSILYEGRVKAGLPAGITPEDSALLYDAIVESWIEKRLLVDVAELNLPTVERIERMVEDYRLQLITNEYRRMMAEANSSEVKEEDAKRYYREHLDEMKLQYPLVKGVYLKMAAGSPQLEEVRAWVASGDPNDISRLENYGLGGAIQYDNFLDTWVSWNSLEETIPYRFNKEVDSVSPGFLFDKRIGSAVYILKIREVLPKGEVMPYEFARTEISRRLANLNRSDYDTDLLKRLYKDAVASKFLKPGGYVPSKFRDVNAEKKK